MKLVVRNEQETQAVAMKLAEFLEAGMMIVLEGDLGAGKTSFTKGLAKGLDIQKVIKSPTYTLIREYTDGRIPLYHMDMYRLEEVGGSDLGLEEYFMGDGVSVIEWANFIAEELPSDKWIISLQRLENIEMRQLTIKVEGQRYQTAFKQFCEALGSNDYE